MLRLGVERRIHVWGIMGLHEKIYSMHRTDIGDIELIKAQFRPGRYLQRGTCNIGAGAFADIHDSLRHKFFHRLLEGGLADNF